MKKQPRIVVIGSLVLDFVARAPRLPGAGETLLGNMFGMFPGGKGANQAVQARRLGALVHMIGCVGDDFMGERLLASLEQSGVDNRFVRCVPGINTAACCIHVDARGNNAIVIVPEANLMCGPADIEASREVIGAADIVLLQLEIPVATVAYAISVIAEYKVPVILNPAPAQALDSALLREVSILTPNEHEAQLLTGFKEPSAAAASLQEIGTKTVVVTVGERGAFLSTPEESVLIPSHQVEVIDSTAAGDAFNGALAVALAEGQPIGQAVRFANAAGALACTRAGAQPSLATRAEVEALLGRESDE
jgi:ribokinase